MFFRRRPPRPATVQDQLLDVLREHLPDTPEDDVEILGAVAGLVACVAYADGVYHPAEVREVKRLLGRIHDLPRDAVDAVCALLDLKVAELARRDVHDHARILKQGTERGARVEVLEVLVDLAAADGQITVDETELLRRVTNMLGLSASDYVAAQSRHRDKLSVLD
ncbi:MAG: TerB family tellurite resistance protein [Sandaracinaceae bacterium]|nr:TerB family tellurite resistance protein [Sandaracinaceae bacterium]